MSKVNTLPKGWEIKTLGDICEIYQPKTISKKDMVFDGEFPVFGANGIIGQYYKYNHEDSQLLITCRGATCGAVNISLPKSWINGNAMVVKPMNSSLNRDFLEYLFRGNIDISRIITGAAQPQITRQNLAPVKIPLPPLPEQKRIVSILDKAFVEIDKVKTNAEQNLKNAKELFESYLQKVFENKGDDWEEKTFKEVCAKITDGTHQTPKYFDNGVIFLSSRNVTSGRINWDNVKYIDEKQHIEMHKRIAPKINDILLAKNGTTGVAAMVDRNVVFDIYVSLAHIRVLDEILPNFMLYFINSPIAKKQFNKRLKGAGVPNLHLQEIREVIINFPKSKDKQKQIIKKLNTLQTETKKLETIYQQKIADLEELKKSILQKAFNGELS